MADIQKTISTKDAPPVKSISDDVTTVEFSRMLKRAGCPQTSKYYWYGEIPSLTSIQDIEAIAVEEKRKMRWLLVDQKPREPFSSAYTEIELRALFKDKTIIPVISKERDRFIGNIKGKPLFFNKNRQNIYALSLLYYLDAR